MVKSRWASRLPGHTLLQAPNSAALAKGPPPLLISYPERHAVSDNTEQDNQCRVPASLAATVKRFGAQ